MSKIHQTSSDTNQQGSQSQGSMDSESSSSEANLLLKVQTAVKDWNRAPEELVELRKLLLKTGYEVDWKPKRLGINMLTPNKIRGMVLKRVLMKLYPFEAFWESETLDETLHKCLLVCQQLALQTDRAVIWGQCSMNASFEFWKTVLLKTTSVVAKARNDDECVQLAKSFVISALISARGTDWDKQIARNFANALGNNRFSAFLKSHKSVIALAKARQNLSANAKISYHNPISFRPYTANKRKFEFRGTSDWNKMITTTSLTSELKKESQDMDEVLRSIEQYYRNSSVLQIGNAFILGKLVADLTGEFEGYMTANNRGAFKDVESLTNHTDKVIRLMSKLASAYGSFFLEFQKYFQNAGGGDELSLAVAMSKLSEFAEEM